MECVMEFLHAPEMSPAQEGSRQVVPAQADLRLTGKRLYKPPQVLYLQCETIEHAVGDSGCLDDRWQVLENVRTAHLYLHGSAVRNYGNHTTGPNSALPAVQSPENPGKEGTKSNPNTVVSVEAVWP